ncbi:MAG: helix-turn-helix domain-containing protein [Acidobacteria bacterium]|nr:helix-turn-helix domain-containing protein [Acidobacteriota bacterium]MBV9475949.1 helix-turn-helix domain-containing protein [Acidobacteriota bacterium]
MPSALHPVQSFAAPDALSVQLIHYPAGLQLPPHAHNAAGFAFTFSGGYVERYAGIAFTCRSGVVTFSPPGERHSNAFDGAPSRCLVIDLHPAWLQSLELAPSFATRPDFFRGEPFTDVARRFVRELGESDSATPLVMRALTMELLALAMRGEERRHRRAPQWLLHVRERLSDDFAHNATLAELAREAGVHPVHLATQFRAHFGCTVGEFLRRRRIEFACEEIRGGEASLLDIAQRAGFATQSHFSRVFRAVVGRTPTEFRDATRAGR